MLGLDLLGALRAGMLDAAARKRVTPVEKFGSNPGALRMLAYAPARLRPGRPLVVVLHGCGQTAAPFATDAGWLALAQEYRFALLLPEQTRANNAGRCFNWFRPEDSRRGVGEAMSIRQMIRTAVKRHGSDPRQIFIVGFSAGGGMAAALLAGYPALFAAGTVVAGMPVGSAASSARAMLRMHRADPFPGRVALAGAVRAVSGTPLRKSWPRLSVWQGERDRTVDPGNAELLAAQWGELHRQNAAPLSDETVAGVRRRAWGRPNRPAAVELWTLASMGHGFPVDPRQPGGGRTGAWLIDAGVGAARLIIAFWGLQRPRA